MSGTASSGAAASTGAYWTDVKCTLSEMKALDKPQKPIILANGTAIMIWLAAGKVFCTAANGTAFEYPLIDAELFDSADGKPAVRSKLDGSSYDLATGKVLEWCPKEDSPFSMRNLLSALKEKALPVDLRIYPTRLAPGERIEILFRK